LPSVQLHVGAEAQWLFLPEPDTRNSVSIRNPGNHEPAFPAFMDSSFRINSNHEGILVAGSIQNAKWEQRLIFELNRRPTSVPLSVIGCHEFVPSK
jgi:hypothetical protein